jgi:hypothetical protein
MTQHATAPAVIIRVHCGLIPAPPVSRPVSAGATRELVGRGLL